MRKEEQPIVEPVAFLVANAMIPHEPVKAKGWSNEPFPAFYPADREADAKEAARILRAVCEPLYPASIIEALQAEIERLKRLLYRATERLAEYNQLRDTAESEASVLRKRVNETVRGEDWENAAHELLWKAGLTTLFDKLSARAKQEAAARAAIAKAEGGNNEAV